MRLATESLVPFVARIALPFAARTAVGLLLALLVAGVCYVMALGIVISFWERTPQIVNVTAIMAIGVGAGIGGSLAWADLDAPRPHILIGLMVGVLAAIGGAWVGLQYGRTVYIQGGMPGIAELSGIIRGAVLAGNIGPMVLGLIRASWFRHREH